MLCRPLNAATALQARTIPLNRFLRLPLKLASFSNLFVMTSVSSLEGSHSSLGWRQRDTSTKPEDFYPLLYIQSLPIPQAEKNISHTPRGTQCSTNDLRWTERAPQLANQEKRHGHGCQPTDTTAVQERLIISIKFRQKRHYTAKWYHDHVTEVPTSHRIIEPLGLEKTSTIT